MLTLFAPAAEAQAPSCPCTLFSAADAPFGDAVWDSPVEVGVRFRSDASGYITALRFYRQPGNAGPREGHLWSSSGELLATVQFPDGPTGWQEEQLSAPLAVTAGTTYTASYYASTGRFAFSGGTFNMAGIDRAPLHAPAAFDGGNGVYRYGASPGFPTDTWNGTNYWVDVVFHNGLPPDTRPPGLSSTSPAAGSSGATPDTKVKAVFDEAIDPLTINSGALTLSEGANVVPAGVAYDAATRTATLTPTAPLSYGKTYTATVKSGNAGPADLAGNRLTADITWTFTTPAQCPCTIFAPDQAPGGSAVKDQPLEVGVKFRTSEDGFITGLRFYKHSNNTGAHVAHLWSGSGQLLASAGYTNETASGWQEARLPNPVAVTKDTTYVASYYSPNGFYPPTSGYFNTAAERAPMYGLAAGEAGGNGVYRYGPSGFPTDTWNATNYWVDATFDRTIPPDTLGPNVVTSTPANASTDQARTVNVTAEFDEPLSAASVTAVNFMLRDSEGTAVPASVSYDAQTRTATLDPDAPLAFDTTYTATLKGGATGIRDVSNNPIEADKSWTFTVEGKSPADGPGGPILLVTSPTDPFGRYYAEILRAEGLNAFEAVDGPVTAAKLTGKTTVLLASPSITDAEATTLNSWVSAGGNLIATRPDKKLAGLLGLTATAGTLANAYLKVDNGSAVGAGIDGQTLQFHGTADRYTLNGATALATLYSDASTATTNPATTLRSVGASGGQAAAFTYDLARSVVYTRQGNPDWVDDKRDNTAGWIPTTRPSDLFYGPKAGDVEPNWVDMDKIDVPQADEQQRLLVKLITEMNLDKAPLPRFWYLPRGEKAAVVLTADDHGVGGVTPWLNRMNAMSPTGCSVENWECVRGTTYAYTDTPITDAQAAAFQAQGHELGLHVNTGCNSYTAQTYRAQLTSQLAIFAANWPSLAPPVSNRTHCVAWSGWVTQPKEERAKGIRFDTNYYYQGPEGWLTKSGLLTGGGFPQRFADLDGTMVDVYQAMTQVTDETEGYLGNPRQLHVLLDNALGPKAYYGAFTVLTHSDLGDHNNANTMVAEAQRRGVPVVSSKQMLDWTDGRNGSAFSDIAYNGGSLTFAVTASPKANGLEAMLPASSATGPLSKLRRDGQAVSWKTRTVKGQEYVVFKALSGAYTATYATDTTAPEITAVSATADDEGRATVRWTTDEPASSRVEYGRTSALGYAVDETARVTEHEIEISGLARGTTYHLKVSSTDTAGNTGTSTPAPLALPAGAVVDTRTTDFAAGAVSNTFIGQTLNGLDGEFVLRPTVGENFDGGLPATWQATPWDAGGFTTVADGSLYTDGGVAYTEGLYGAPRALDFVATLQPVNDQGAGFGNTFSDYPFAVFSTGGNGEALQLYALSGASSATRTSTALPGVSLSRPHRFRIEWNASNVRYFVDGALVATHTISIAGPMRPLASDYKLFGAGVDLDWVRMSTYSAAGTFTSRVLDGGPGANQWQTLTAATNVPAGTAIQWQTRTGATPVPNGSWSPFVNLGAGNAVASPPGRYIQYQARLTRSSASTPTVQRVQISYVAGTDAPPVLGTVAISPAAPRTTQTVTATPSGFSDPDGDPLTYHYRWYRNGTAIPGATSTTLNLALAGNGDLNDKIRVEVYATDGRGAASDAAIDTRTVANTAPTAGSAAVRPAPPSTNDVVTAVPSGFADIDGETLSYRYQWRRNNTPIAGATAKTLDLSLAGNGNQGDRIDVDISAVDGSGGVSPTVRGGQNITATNSTPVPGEVSITPAAPKTKDTLTANTAGFRDPDGNPLTYAYQWKRNGTAIAGATAQTLDLAAPGVGDIGDTLSVDVTARDSLGATSDPATGSKTIVNTPPVSGAVTVKPSVPATNDVLAAATTGFKDDDGDGLTYEYQWYRNGAAMSGQTGRSLDLSEPGNGDLGDTLMVRVKALDGRGGTTSTIEGSATISAANSNPVASFGFEEAAGTVVVDETGGHDGDAGTTARSNAGRFGRALYFDGEDDKVTVEHDATLNLSMGMTLEAWVKPDATTNWRTIIFKETGGGLGYTLYANSQTDNASVHLGLPEGEAAVDATEELDPNAWTHLAATFDGHIIRLFANGVQIASKAAEGPLGEGSGPLTFGANNVWGEYYKGLIDEVRVYNRPLSAADIAADMQRPVVAGTPAPPSTTNPEQIGQFEKPMTWPMVPVHLSLLSDGKVAAWDGFEYAVNSERRWDPATKQFESITTGRNLFCAGHITLTDGRLLVVGGHVEAYEGTKDTNLFDPKAGTWTRGQDMAVARWYPSATALSDGRVFVVSGDNPVLDRPNQSVPLTIASNTLPEIYNPATDTWQQLPQAQRWMPLYPFMFLLPNGKLFDAGPDKTTRTLDLSTGTWTAVGGNSIIDGHSAVMYRPGKILKSGTWSEPEFPDRTTTNKAVAIDFNEATPQWREVAPMSYRRSYHTLTALPDGKVLATGGQTGTDGVDQTTGVLASEIWDPDTNTWTTTASSRRPRLYHSSALLLPSGQVLLAGGGTYGNARNENNAELYSPPYLFKGPRPQVTAAPERVHYNTQFTVDTPDASRIAKVNLVRMGSVTHNFDMDQRLIPATMTKQAGSVRITGPANANVAPPGWYMVFLVDDNGVPSEGQIVRLDAEGDAVPPSAPTSLTAIAEPAGAALAWAASADNVGVKEYRVYRSTTNGFTPSSANRIARVKTATSYVDAGLAAGTYYYRVQAVDAAGNISASSAQVSAVVAGDTVAPAVSVTAPAANASLSATVAVTATATDAVGVKSVQFKLDGQDLGSADTSAPYTVNWDTTTAADGPHALTAIAKDATGNATTSAPVAVKVHNTGLVAAYGFEETTGATAKDSVNTNDGTISGATRVTDGRFGRALSFDGVSNSVSVPHSQALDLAGGMTLQAWVKPTALDSWRSVILKERTGALTYALFANTDANVPSAHVFTSSDLAANAPAILPLSTWAHLSMTWDGAALKLYIDGALVSTQTAPGPLVTSSGQLKIGGDDLRSEWFSGLIDEVRIYNRALSAAELQADMNRAVKP